MKKILGISAFYHDSAATIVIDGKIVAAAQEERFNRIKHTADFPVQAIQYCLTEAGLDIDELDAVVFYDKPLLKFERLLETYYAFSPKGLFSFLKAIPIWINEKLFLKRQIYNGLKEIGVYDKKKITLLFTEHHLSHAASTFYASPFQEAAILTIDGVGEWCTASIGHGQGTKLSILKEMTFPHSVGLLYSAFTYYLGFKVNSGEYKLMGLAPYGNPNAIQTKQFIESIQSILVDIKEDGSIWLDQSYFSYATGLRMVKDDKWKRLFGITRRQTTDPIEQNHCNLAFAIQQVTEEIILKMAKEAQRITKSVNLCMAGGVALNCVANGKLLKAEIFENIYVQPAAGDSGGSLGAALAANYIYFDESRESLLEKDKMNGTYLGPNFSNKEIEQMSRKVKAVYFRYESFSELCQNVATKISEGQIVGWFQDRMEFGPRALGNRSILGDPRQQNMQKKINLKIKNRESFRPFAPSVLKEVVDDYFELEGSSPYMLFVSSLKEVRRKKLPDDFHQMSLKEKLNQQGSDLPSITHVDFSARIQTVDRAINPNFWELIDAFRQKTGVGLLINTSFNVRGEPIVCTPYDAYRCFMSTDMDYLVINNYVYCKTKQPNWDNKEKWRTKFKSD